MTSPCDIDSFGDCSVLFSVLKYNVNYFHSFLNDDDMLEHGEKMPLEMDSVFVKK